MSKPVMRQMPANELVLYDDADGRILATDIDLGRIPVGEKTQVTKYIRNHSDKWPFQNIRMNESDPEVTAEFPQILAPGAIMPVVITFFPSLARREPLEVENLFIGELWIG